MKAPYSTLKSLLWAGWIFTAASGLAACGNAESSAPSAESQATAPAVQSAIAKDVDVNEFIALMHQEGALVLDVRSDGEWAEGHLEGAAYIPFQSDDFSEQLAALPHDRPVLVYCAAGGRSAKAMNLLNAAGHPEVYNLVGGIGAWKEAGQSVVFTDPITVQ